ncbi:MAG: hypothetical protein A3F10_00135 [Coxiella sp. RIFCSPHIGHO2_12_FULL_42_15]|nr:MAG: hypothetical protein A3F10_00135 [Coxiella sp. RIFCSPHIGHO2_12_FULL_42_15]
MGNSWPFSSFCIKKRKGKIMESKYTATVYNNDHVIKRHVSDDLKKLIVTLLVQLDNCISGSHGIIRDNALGMNIQCYKKAVLED